MPFKSEKQRKYLWAKHPEVAEKWTSEGYATGGMIKKSITNNMKLADFSRMRAGGMVRDGRLAPNQKNEVKVQDFQSLVCKKSKES